MSRGRSSGPAGSSSASGASGAGLVALAPAEVEVVAAALLVVHVRRARGALGLRDAEIAGARRRESKARSSSSLTSTSVSAPSRTWYPRRSFTGGARRPTRRAQAEAAPSRARGPARRPDRACRARWNGADAPRPLPGLVPAPPRSDARARGVRGRGTVTGTPSETAPLISGADGASPPATTPTGRPAVPRPAVSSPRRPRLLAELRGLSIWRSSARAVAWPAPAAPGLRGLGLVRAPSRGAPARPAPRSTARSSPRSGRSELARSARRQPLSLRARPRRGCRSPPA